MASLYSSPKVSKAMFVKTVGGLDALIFAIEVVRLRSPYVNKLALKALGCVMRAHELDKFSGIMYCLFGVAVSAQLFPKHIAILGMLQLAIGDPLAAFFGHASRKLTWARIYSNKSILGTLAFAACMTGANYALLSSFSCDEPLVAGLLIAAFASLVELLVPSPRLTLPWKSLPLALDDNAALPILASLGAALVFSTLDLAPCSIKLPLSEPISDILGA
ncbi:unnamed protein product [Chrysoparadoxa australica]